MGDESEGSQVAVDEISLQLGDCASRRFFELITIRCLQFGMCVFLFEEGRFISCVFPVMCE